MAKSSKNTPKKVVKTTSKRVVKTSAPSAPKAEKKRPMPTAASTETTQEELPFTRTNYVLLIIGIVIILAGFVLMSMDEFIDATEFSVSLYIAPILVVGGFIEVIFAIMYRADDAAAPSELSADAS